tara:strand:- start:14 stop:340 length:327 start_codon:yes stop_codon:yes gene_type:complete
MGAQISNGNLQHPKTNDSATQCECHKNQPQQPQQQPQPQPQSSTTLTPTTTAQTKPPLTRVIDFAASNRSTAMSLTSSFKHKADNKAALASTASTSPIEGSKRGVVLL